jgi:hypothetical protein
MIKVHDRKKAPPYLTPLNGGFKMRPAIRESEREAFLSDGDLASGHDAISWVGKCPAGFDPHFEIAGETDFGPLESSFREPMTCVR